MKQFINNQFSFFVFTVFMVLSIITVFYHEIWMDEAYHYLLARDSHSILEIIKNGTQSGHPILWNILLFGYKFICPDVICMQLLHCAIAGVCIFLINRYSPFSKLENILISFSYFFLYEYTIISKNYILGFCLLFIALVLHNKKKSLLLIAFILALASNLHLFTLFIAIFLFVYILLNNLAYKSKKELVSSIVLMLLGVIISLIQIIPSSQHINEYKSYDAPSWFSTERLSRSLNASCKGLLNIPDFRQDSYWNSNIIVNLNHIAGYMISILLLVLMYVIFKKRRSILLLFFGPVLLIMMFVYFAPLAVGVRYWGFFYVLLIMCYWLYKQQAHLSNYSKLIFRMLLFVQFLVSIPILALEYKTSFSKSKEAAQSIKAKGLNNYPLFVQHLGLGPSLSAYTNKKIYYPSSKSFESYSYYVKQRAYSVPEFISESVCNLYELRLDSCILVMKQAIADSLIFPNKKYQILKLSEHTGSMILSENYYLYLLHIK